MLKGFLETKTGLFMLELWKLLIEAQNEPNGIPKSLIEKKKLEYVQKCE